MEPEKKRIKLARGNDCTMDNAQIKCILSDEYINDVKTIEVFIGTIKDMKSISTLIDQLSKSLPLLDLLHLKRVRENQIILCKTDSVELQDSNSDNVMDEQFKKTVSKYLSKQGLDGTIALELCIELTITKVASTSPKLRWQYDAMNKLWPCKFHPNKYLERLFNNSNFDEEQKLLHIRIMSAVRILAKSALSRTTAICTDPRTNSIVATALDELATNPVLHSPMVLIDMVAKTQNGGVWNYPHIDFMQDTDESSYAGISKEHYEILNENFKDFNYGAEKVELTRKITETDNVEQDNLTKYGPYLCTGYDVYLLKEPCLMCAMALIHSRVKRVFYIETIEKGALGSHLKLHTIKELNHHFEAFRISEINR